MVLSVTGEWELAIDMLTSDYERPAASAALELRQVGTRKRDPREGSSDMRVKRCAYFMDAVEKLVWRRRQARFDRIGRIRVKLSK
jgi:hypothetical protein